MSRRYHEYPSYRDCELDGVRRIPADWSLTRLKFVSRCLDGQRIPLNATERGELEGEIPYWGANKVVGHVNDFLFDEDLVLLGEDGAPFFEPNRDVAFFVTGKIWPNNHVHVLRPDTARIEPRFLTYGLNCAPFHLHITGSTRDKLNQSDMNEIVVRWCPLEEQTQIAKFLDYETARIDALIEKQQQLIALLKEKREGLLHVAINEKGTENVRLEHCWKRVSRRTPRLNDELYYPIGLLNRGRGIFHKDPTLGCDLGDSDFFYVEEGDLILSGQFAWEGAVGLAGAEESGCVATHRYPIVRGKPEVTETAFLWALFTSQIGDFLLNQSSRGAAGRNRPLNMNSLKKEKIPVPPLEAQQTVAKLVFQEKALRERIQKPIALLQERRTALISAAVTGKIDVRDWNPPDDS